MFKRSRVVSWEMVWGMNSAKRYAGVPDVAKGVQRGPRKERMYPHFSTTLSFYAMRPVWLRPEWGGDWVHFGTVAEAIKDLKTKGINVWPAQLSVLPKRLSPAPVGHSDSHPPLRMRRNLLPHPRATQRS